MLLCSVHVGVFPPLFSFLCLSCVHTDIGAIRALVCLCLFAKPVAVVAVAVCVQYTPCVHGVSKNPCALLVVEPSWSTDDPHTGVAPRSMWTRRAVARIGVGFAMASVVCKWCMTDVHGFEIGPGCMRQGMGVCGGVALLRSNPIRSCLMRTQILLLFSCLRVFGWVEPRVLISNCFSPPPLLDLIKKKKG